MRAMVAALVLISSAANADTVVKKEDDTIRCYAASQFEKYCTNSEISQAQIKQQRRLIRF